MIQLNQTWQGELQWSAGTKLPPEFLHIKFIFHVNFVDRNNGFEAIIEDDPEQLGFESHARALGSFTDDTIFFSKIYSETNMYWPDISPTRNCPVASEFHYQGNLYESGAVVGFWQFPSVFRRFDDEVLQIPAGSGTWSMNVL